MVRLEQGEPTCWLALPIFKVPFSKEETSFNAVFMECKVRLEWLKTSVYLCLLKYTLHNFSALVHTVWKRDIITSVDVKNSPRVEHGDFVKAM